MLALAVGVILLDYSYQALFNPCESLLSDLMQTSSEKEQTLAFTIYSACISLGCILGYLIVSVDWTSLGIVMTTQEQTAFTVIFLLFLPCLFLTLVSAKEKPLKKQKISAILSDSASNISGSETENKNLLSNKDSGEKTIKEVDGGYESGTSEADDASPLVMSSTQMFFWRSQRALYYLIQFPKVNLKKRVLYFLKNLMKLLTFLFLLPLQVSIFIIILI